MSLNCSRANDSERQRDDFSTRMMHGPEIIHDEKVERFNKQKHGDTLEMCAFISYSIFVRPSTMLSRNSLASKLLFPSK